jgi:hypothetical protein
LTAPPRHGPDKRLREDMPEEEHPYTARGSQLTGSTQMQPAGAGAAEAAWSALDRHARPLKEQLAEFPRHLSVLAPQDP